MAKIRKIYIKEPIKRNFNDSSFMSFLGTRKYCYVGPAVMEEDNETLNLGTNSQRILFPFIITVEAFFKNSGMVEHLPTSFIGAWRDGEIDELINRKIIEYI